MEQQNERKEPIKERISIIFGQENQPRLEIESIMRILPTIGQVRIYSDLNKVIKSINMSTFTLNKKILIK